MDYTPQPVPSATGPELRHWLDTEHRRIAQTAQGLRSDLEQLGPSLSGFWLFDSGITAVDPGQGELRFNSATPASVTEIYVAEISERETNAENLFEILSVDDVLLIQQQNDATRYIRCTIASAPTDNGTWWTIPVTITASGALPVNRESLNFIWLGGGDISFNPSDSQTVTGDWIFAGDRSAATFQGATPSFLFNETDAASDEKLWEFIASGGDFTIQTRTDANGVGAPIITISRTGTTVDLVQFSAPVGMSGVDANGYALRLTGIAPFVQFEETDADADEGFWDFGAASLSGSGTFRFRVSTDSGTDSNWMIATRSGTAVSSVAFPMDNLELRLGASGDDLAIYHDGSNNYIDSNTGSLFIHDNGGNIRARIANSTATFQLYSSATDDLGSVYMAFIENDASTVKGLMGFSSTVSNIFVIQNSKTTDSPQISIRTNTTGTAGGIVLAPNVTTKLHATSDGIAFNGQSPAAPPNYTTSGISTNRTGLTGSATLAVVEDVLGTLIADLIAIGLLQ
jgi:hypothetical protein